MNDAAGEFAHHLLVGVSLLQRGCHGFGLDVASVDKKVLIGAGAAAAHRHTGKAFYRDAALAAALNGQETQRQIAAQHAVKGRLELSVAGGAQLGFALFDESKGHLGVGQRLVLDYGEHRRALGGVPLDELQAGGRVEKQVADDHGGTHRAAAVLPFGDHAALQRQGNAQTRVGCAGHQIDPRHSGDRRQGFAAETQRADGLQIVLGADFAGGVAQKGHLGVLGRDAAAVVSDPDHGHAAAADLYRDAGRARVDGVFQQLLDYAGGAFHHLAGGNQIGHMRGKLLNMRHSVFLQNAQFTAWNRIMASNTACSRAHDQMEPPRS